MIWGKTHTQKKKDKESKFPEGKNWFAWHPVRLDDGRWAWREWLWRKRWSSWNDTGYTYYISINSWENK